MRLLIRKKKFIWGVGLTLAAIIITLGIVLARQVGQRSTLSEELVAAEQVLSIFEAGQSSWQDGIETQLDGTLVSFDTAMTELSQPIDSIIANEALFNIARASSVTLTAITVSPLYGNTLAELPCYLLPLNISAEGDAPQLLDFITRLNTELTNGLVRSAILTISDELLEYDSSVDIELVIYNYQGE